MKQTTKAGLGATFALVGINTTVPMGVRLVMVGWMVWLLSRDAWGARD